MAKSKAKSEARVAPRQRTARDDEARNQRLLIGGVALIILIIGGLVAFGWWWTEIKPLDKTVLQVNSTKYNLNHVVRRMRLEFDTNAALYEGNPFLLSQSVIQALEREAKVLEAAGTLNDISVSEDDVSAEVRERGGLAANASSAEFVRELERQVDESHLKKGEFTQMLRAQLLEEKVRNYFTFVTPESEEQARVRWIVLPADDQAVVDDAEERLAAGEDFADVATDLSIDPQTSEDGGEIGWSVRGQLFVDEVEKFVFEEAEVGDRSEAIETPFGFYIVEVEEKDDDRDLDESQRSTVSQRLFTEWLDGLDDDLTITLDFTEQDEVRALEDVLS